MKRKSYIEKLKDPRWQRRRLEILNRDNFTCRACGDTKNTLDVHHLKYRDNPWESLDEELLTFCDGCHSLWHRDEYSRRLLLRMAGADSSDAAILRLERDQWRKLFYSVLTMPDLLPLVTQAVEARGQDEHGGVVFQIKAKVFTP